MLNQKTAFRVVAARDCVYWKYVLHFWFLAINDGARLRNEELGVVPDDIDPNSEAAGRDHEIPKNANIKFAS